MRGRGIEALQQHRSADEDGLATSSRRLAPYQTIRVSVTLPQDASTTSTDVPILDANMTVREVLDFLGAEHRLPLYQPGEVYQLYLSSIDQARLKLTSPVLGLNVAVASLGVEKLSLVRSKFYS